MTTTILFPDSSLEPISGEITFVSPEIDAVNQQVRVWGEFDNTDGIVRPGLIATMHIAVAQPSAGESGHALPGPAKAISK
jgi:multidrug efflux pump subunit AcrA (membrane-fusion protein)